jgi:hypothetical protein
MKTICGLLIFLISAFSLHIKAFGQDQASTPVFKEGDSWQFSIARKGGITSSTELNDGTYEIIYAQGKVKLYEVSGSQKTELEIQPDGPTQGLLTLVGKSEQRQTLKFPLSAGQKWTYQYVTKPAGQPQDQRRSVEVNVAATEQVTTPAGSFKAYKLVRGESWSTGKRGNQGGQTVTYFYSPDTRSVIKSSNQSEGSGANVETELIKFTPGN